MGRRRALKSVAEGTLGAFVGRNGEVDGYWAIGVLCRRVLERGDEGVELDVLAREIRPEWSELRGLVARCRERLFEHLRAVGLWEEAVGAVRIRVSFEPTAREHAASVRYRCVVTLVDDRGKEIERSREGWCWAHDPARESRSVRVGRGAACG